MNVLQQFRYSLYHFKRVSAFRMLNVGKPIGYIFFLSFITMIPITLGLIIGTSPTEPIESLPLPIELLFLYLLNTSFKFIEVSILAFIGLGLNTYLNRNIQYRHSWRLAAYAITIPTLLFTIIENIGIAVSTDFLLSLLLSTFILFLIIRSIPKPKR